MTPSCTCCYLLFVVISAGLRPLLLFLLLHLFLLLLLFSSVLRSTFPLVLLPVRTSVTRSVTATSRPLFTSGPSWPVSGGESAPGSGWGWLGVAGGCGISVSACLCNRRRRLSGPLSADQHRCRWEVKSSPVTSQRRQRTLAQAGQPSTTPPFPPSSLKPSVALLGTPLPRTCSVHRPLCSMIAAARMEWALTKCRD